MEFRQSEDESIKYTKELLPGWNYSTSGIDKIVGMIQATKKPQQPKNVLEQIIGDSDLDYLGTDQFYKVADKLYKVLAFKIISIEKEWDRLQVEFLRNTGITILLPLNTENQ